MCPQPPKAHDEKTYDIAVEVLNLVKPQRVKTICITGGEPTLLGDRFLEVMRLVKKRFDHAVVLVLTNGKSFSNFSFAKKFAQIGLSNATLCVSLHSDLEDVHDEICDVKGSFHKTVQGIYNLARVRQSVEIRHVIGKQNANRLEQFGHFIYRNFPFVDHVAFMGMETTGLAVANIDSVWVDPFDYQAPLSRAVRQLHRTALHVSIYNVPLCLLERKSWSFARQSISEWKNEYLPVCHNCSLKTRCCGFFATSQRHSDRINPFP